MTRRNLWLTVSVVVLSLIAISAVTASKESVAEALHLLALAASWTERGLDLAGWPAAAGVGATALAAGVVVAVRKRRTTKGGFAQPWQTVIEMGKKGRSAAVIAQATGLPQDAVRIVLAPVALERDLPRGKSFRSSPPVEGADRASRHSDR